MKKNDKSELLSAIVGTYYHNTADYDNTLADGSARVG
jgi:hypothetical protein